VSIGPFVAIESKLIVAACRDASVIRGISEFVHWRPDMPQQLV
jgi:hypothetical protein